MLKDRGPWYSIRDESPTHISAANLAVRGMSFSRIARIFGRSTSWMSNLSRQRFFQERCAAIVETINTDLLQQQVPWRRVRPLIVVGMHDAGGSCDVASVSYAIDLLNRPICEGPAGQAAKKQARPRVQNGHQAASKPVPAPKSPPEPSWRGGDDQHHGDDDHFAETPLVNPLEVERRRVVELAELDRYENYRRYCP